jgi:hypothetical protein
VKTSPLGGIALVPPDVVTVTKYVEPLVIAGETAVIEVDELTVT